MLKLDQKVRKEVMLSRHEKCFNVSQLFQSWFGSVEQRSVRAGVVGEDEGRDQRPSRRRCQHRLLTEGLAQVHQLLEKG